MIVEPEPDLRLLAQEAVQELGHEPVVYSGGGKAAQADVLLVVPGPDTTALIAALGPAARSLPIVCAGIAPPGEEARLLHPVAYLAKPYTLADLGRALAKALATPRGGKTA